MNDELKRSIINRLHRLEGQVRGVEKMVDQKKPYPQIIQQLEAIRSASSNIIVGMIGYKIENKNLTQEDLEYLKRFIKKM